MINSVEFARHDPQMIKYPLITDKSTRGLEKNQYTFVVARSSDKTKIKKTIESFFQVKVIKINTARLPRKQKRVGKYMGWKAQYKKAMVTLSPGDVINLFTES